MRDDKKASACLQATDIAMLADMARYMHNDYSSLGGGYSAANFPHANLPHMYWWDWNANSGDTGGIVENDWLTVSHCIPHMSVSDHTALARGPSQMHLRIGI